MAELEWTDRGTPRSAEFDDVYYSDGDGLPETRHTFLNGCGLPEAWSGRDRFVIGETGFGTGLNFLATLELWRATCPGTRRLHYVSVERSPLKRADLVRAHAVFPELARPAADLRDRYPERLPDEGWRRLHFDDDRVVLDLLIGEAGEVLRELEASIDAWFLDGFAPARNPAMWRPEVLAEVARLAAPECRLATFTAAGAVRRGLARVGFEVEKAPGFGAKRERLVGHFRGPGPDTRLPAWAAVPSEAGRPRIEGGGIAGQSLARSFRRRGIDFGVTASDQPAASSLPRALVMPRLTADRSPVGALFAQAFHYARNEYRQAGTWTETGVLQLAEDAADEIRMQKIAGTWGNAEWVSEPAELAGVPVARSGLWYPDAGVVAPPPLLKSVAEQDCQVVIRASGPGAAAGQLEEVLPFEAYRGQLTLVDPSAATGSLKTVVACGHYVTPALDGRHSIGATFDHAAWGALDRGVRDEDHARNVAALKKRIPGFQPGSIVDGWAGIRVALPDRLPAVGPIPQREDFIARYEGLRTGQAIADCGPPTTIGWSLTALGSRGFTIAPLCAELLVSQLLGEPWPVPRTIALILHPARFLVRGLKRREI